MLSKSVNLFNSELLTLTINGAIARFDPNFLPIRFLIETLSGASPRSHWHPQLVQTGDLSPLLFDQS